MAGFDAIGCGSNFFPWTGAWYWLVGRVAPRAAAAVEAHGQVAIACRWHGLAPAWAELAPLLIFTVTSVSDLPVFEWYIPLFD